MSRAESRVWVGFSRFQVPTAIVREGVLLGSVEATLLLVLFKLANTIEPRDPVVTVRVSIKRLTVQTGLADKSVRRALQSLEANKLLTIGPTRKKNGRQFGCNTYVLLNPETGKPLKTEPSHGVCHLNDVPYFPVPTDVVKQNVIARLRLSEKSLYIALLIITGRHQSLTFTAATPMLTKLSDLSAKTFRKAAETLELAGLIVRDRSVYTMCDPITRERSKRYAKAEDNPRNWTTEGKKALDYDTLTPQQWKLVIDGCFKQPYIYAEEGWTAPAKCPYHSGAKPTLSFNFEKGCFKCQSKKCIAKGKLSRLVKDLRKTTEQETQEFIAQSAGIELKFNRPTKDAINTWRYFNDTGTLVKEVFFFADGGFVEKAKGLGRLLYHLPEVRASRTVLVLRNEADCDQMDGMKLRDSDGAPVATTTSGYLTGWLPKFAAELHGKNVVIVYVSDLGGVRFFKDVADSLDECSVEYRRVNLPPEGIMTLAAFTDHIGADWLYDDSQAANMEFGDFQL
jgi:hypothetical protein